jgi:hypothetical protein
MKIDYRPKDWMTDSGISSSSLAAQGLWINMLNLIILSGKGQLIDSQGRKIELKELAKILKHKEEDLKPLIGELESNGVFSRLDNGIIYNRRLYKEWKISEERRAAVNIRWAKEKNPSIKVLVDWWFIKYQEIVEKGWEEKKKPILPYGKMVIIFQTLLKVYSEIILKGAIIGFFNDQDFFLKKNAYDVGLFAKWIQAKHIKIEESKKQNIVQQGKITEEKVKSDEGRLKHESR